MSSVVELTRALVRNPSVSGHEEECVALLTDRLKARVVGRNVIAVRGDGPRTLLLNSHTDTVPASDDWNLDPYEAELRDGKVYGLGANDAKGPLAALVVAFETATIPADARLAVLQSRLLQLDNIKISTPPRQSAARDCFISGSVPESR